MADGNQQNLGNLVVHVDANISGLNSSLNKGQQSLRNFTKSASNSTKSIGNSTGALNGMLKNSFRYIMLHAIIVKGVLMTVQGTINSVKDAMNMIESENLFKVSMGNMAQSAMDWSNTLQQTLGLNAYEVRKNVGVFYNMTTAMGLSKDGAYDMSTSLTQLAYDMSSFYNIPYEDAFTKLQAGITGEIEPLRRLGIIVTDNVTKNYAYANGIAKTGSVLTEQEKVLARYGVIMQTTSAAQGDLARTMNSPANQARRLTTQMELLSINIGRIFLPIIQAVTPVISQMVGALSDAADRAADFMEILFGVDYSSYTGGANSAATAQDKLSASTTDAAKAAKNAQSSMDELNVINKNAGANSGAPSGAGVTPNFGAIANETKNQIESPAITALNNIKQLCDEIGTSFRTGFIDTAKNADFSKITSSLSTIKTSLLNIVSDSDVTSSASKFITAYSTAIGSGLGTLVAVGTNMAANVTTGYSNYLALNAPFISQALSSIFNSGADFSNTLTSLNTFLSETSTILTGETATGITTNLIGIFENGILGVANLLTRFGADFFSLVVTPIINNGPAIQTAIENTLKPIETITGSIKDYITNSFSKVKEVYDTYIDPAFQNFKAAFTGIVGTLVENYNKYIAPVIDELGKKFKTVMSDHIQPAFDAFATFIGKIALALSELWKNILQPVVQWIIDTIMPILAPIFENIGNTIMTVFGFIGDAVKLVWDGLSAFLDFITNIFKGDWDAAWKSVSDYFSEVWTTIKDMVITAWDTIKETFTTKINAIKQVFTTIFTTIKNFLSGEWTAINNGIIAIWTTIVSWIGNKLREIKTTFTNIFNGIKTFLGNIWDGIKARVAIVWDDIKTGLSEKLDNLKSNFTAVFQGIKDFVLGIFEGIWTGIKTKINNILGNMEAFANGIVNAINTIIKAVNGLNIDIPDWVPGLGGKSFGVNIPTINNVSLPRLEKGGPLEAGQYFEAGEDGKVETIGSYKGKTTVMPLENTDFIDSVYQAVYSAMVDSQSKGGNIIENVVKLDGEVIYKNQQRVSQNRGINFGMGVFAR